LISISILRILNIIMFTSSRKRHTLKVTPRVRYKMSTKIYDFTDVYLIMLICVNHHAIAFHLSTSDVAKIMFNL